MHTSIPTLQGKHRRRFVYRVHTIVTMLMTIAAIAYFVLVSAGGLSSPLAVAPYTLGLVTFFVVSLIFHRLWLRYRDGLEAELNRSYGKIKNEAYRAAHLEDTGEFVPPDEDEYPRKRYERR
jgi:membrane protein implicated in regulation of membrane protease activity